MPVALMACALLIGVGSGAVAQSDPPASESAELPPPGSTIQVGSTLDLAPLDFVDEQGNPTGYELDVVQAVMDDLGYEIEWVKTPFEQAFTGLLSGKYQMNASAIYTRCARIESTDEYGHFSVPVGQAGQAVTARAEDAPNIQGWEDMAGLVHGVESAGSTADLLADDNAAAGFTKQIFPDNNALFLALEQGRIDTAGQSEDVTRFTIKDKPGLQVAFLPEGSTLTYGFIFREGDHPLREKVNETINKLKENGTTAEIYKKWFGVDPEPDRAEVMVLPEVTTETCVG
jgi:ABC-type amino acid transport substrate-binding protein